MNQPNLSHINIWDRMEKRIHAVLNQALQLLMQENELPELETKINRKFRDCLIRADRMLKRENGALDSLMPPIYEGNNQPSSDDKGKKPREDKRPDFQYAFYDENEPDDSFSAKFYVIECKRLGKKVGSWVLNENYIFKGVIRFITEEHGYGKDASSGAMIGYIQNMSFGNILSEVNLVAETQNIIGITSPFILLVEDGSQDLSIIYLSSRFDRSFPHSPFKLHHFWVDLRKYYNYKDEGKDEQKTS